MSMVAKLSDLVDETSGANLQAEGHADVLTQSAKDLWGWKHWIVLPPTHHLGLWPRGHRPVALILNIVWRYI